MAADRVGTRKLLVVAVVVPIAVLVGVGLSRIELRVPDTSSAPVATMMQPVNNWRYVGQTFRAGRNGLSRVEVILAAGGRAGDAPLRFHISDQPGAAPIRTVLVDHSSLPLGDPWQFVPGRVDEKWFGFDFEPIEDSAGRRLYFSLEGPGIPLEGTVNTLVFFFNKYPEGQAYVNGDPVWGHVAFRGYSRGTVLEALEKILGNLVYRKPRVLSEVATYVALAAIYLALGGALLRKVWLLAGDASSREQTCRAQRCKSDSELQC